jgi:hypothetical protein
MTMQNPNIDVSAHKQIVFGGEDIAASGSVVFSGFGHRDIRLIVNITGPFNGCDVQFTVTPVDPLDGTTPVGTSVTGAVLNAPGVQMLHLSADSDTFEVSWVVNGAPGPIQNANVALLARAAGGQVKGVGVGAFVPDPVGEYQAPAAGEEAPLSLDGAGNLIARSQVLTDEDSFLDDFPGVALDPVWQTDLQNGGVYVVASSLLTLIPGLVSGAVVDVFREADYAPMSVAILAKINQRVIGQEIAFRFVAAVTGQAAEVVFDRDDQTSVKFRTSSAAGDVLESIVILSGGGVTNTEHEYRLEVNTSYCALFIDGELRKKHTDHIPYPYTVLTLRLVAQNLQVMTSQTYVQIAAVAFRNHDQVEIGMHLDGEVLPVETRGQTKVLVQDDAGVTAQVVTESLASLSASDLATQALLREVVSELRKLNLHLEIMTETHVEDEDVS